MTNAMREQTQHDTEAYRFRIASGLVHLIGPMSLLVYPRLAHSRFTLENPKSDIRTWKVSSKRRLRDARSR